MKDRDPAAQVVAVSGKDRSAIMMGGHKADETMWLAPTGLTSYRGTSLSPVRSEEHTSALQSLMPNSYAVFCLKNIQTYRNSHDYSLCTKANRHITRNTHTHSPSHRLH